MPNPPSHDLNLALRDLVAERAVKRGRFQLASGREATFYIDAKQVVLDSQGAMLVGRAILERLGALGPLPAAVGGMSIGADPITAAVVTMAGVAGLPLKGFMVRKEPKGHGLQRFIEGPVEPGQRVVIVEDVVTTGGSSLLAIDRAQEFGLVVDRVITVIDRLAGAEAAFAARLTTAGMPDPDLLIRTAGEMRISNFLLWQISYAELWVTPVFWPEFAEAHFDEALADFARRDRRFGGIGPS